MNEDFVTYELAVKLKEKGFDWETSNVYERNTIACRYEDYPKPTISQVLKWLREEKGINVNMRLFVENGWYFTIQNYKGEPIHSQLTDTDDLYLSYEQAALAGFEYCLDNLI